MNAHKIVFSLVFLTITMILIMQLWHFPLVLPVIIVFLAFIKHKVMSIKKELSWFIIIGLLGSTFENIIIFSGAWNYSQVFFIHIPLWLPFVWGISGTIAISLYEGVTYDR